MSAPTVIAGHSHLTSFGAPLQSKDGRSHLAALPASAQFELLNGPWPRDKEYWATMAELARSRRLVIVWMGNQHHANFLIAPSPPFDFVSSLDPELPTDPGHHLVPELAIRAVLQPSMSGLHSILARMRKAGTAAGVVIAGTPPPKADDDFIRRHFTQEAHFARVARRLKLDPATLPLCAPVLRLKLWLLLQDFLQYAARHYGCIYCPSPDDAHDARGFLRRDLWAPDATHANERYGALMLRDLAPHVSASTA